jgi:hypothetical protein
MKELKKDDKDFFEELENRPRPNVLRRIQLWWRHDGRYYHKYLREGIVNIIYWFPIIWKDRNWDQGYIFDILQHKLKAQSKYIGGEDRHTRAQYDAQRMNLCVNLIQKLQDGFYEMEYMDYAKDRHWFEPCKDNSEYSTWESENIWEKYDDYFKKYPNIYRRVMNGEGFAPIKGREDDKHFIAMSMGHMNQDRAHKLLFKIMERDIRGWWD